MLREAILIHTAEIHFKFIQTLSESEMVDPMFNDPISHKMWHPKFEPLNDSMISDLPFAALSAQPNHQVQHRSNSIKNFVSTLNPSSKSIVKRAIREASQESSNDVRLSKV